MQSLTVEESVADALAKLSGMAEVRDEYGNVLGFYAPVSPEQAARYAEAAANIGADQKLPRPNNGPPPVTNGTADNLKALESH